MGGTVSLPSASWLKLSQICWQFEHADKKIVKNQSNLASNLRKLDAEANVAHAYNSYEGEMTCVQII